MNVLVGVVMRGSAIVGLVGSGLLLAGCASSAGDGLNLNAGLADAVAKAPFYEAAQSRAASTPRTIQMAAASGAGAGLRQSGRSRAYSGSPDGLSRRVVFERGGTIDAPRAIAYMHEIIDRLLAQWPYELPRVGVFVVNQGIFDAQVTAAGDILIASGMLAALESEDELAAVLGHELAHLMLDHHKRAEAAADNKRALNAVTSVAVTALMFTNTSWTKTGQRSYQGTVNGSSWMRQSLMAGGACLAATYLIDKLIDPNMNREQEDEADLLGIDLMLRAGYNPNAAVQAMRRRVEFEEGMKKSMVEQRRESGAYENMVSEAVQRQGILGIFTGAARGIAAGVIDTLSDIDDYITKRHRQSQDRLTNMQLYLDRHYPLRERTQLKSASYAAAIGNRETQTIFENHRLAHEATKLLGSDNAKALELAKLSIRSPTQFAVAPRLAMFMVLSEMQRDDEAFEQLLKVRNLDGAPPQFFHALANGYASRGKLEKANEMKERAIALSASIYDEKEKPSEGNLLARLLTQHSGAGVDRFEVRGYCEALRSGVNAGASAIAGREL